MGKWLLILGIISFNSLQAQMNDTLRLDLDADNKIDQVILDRSNSKIVCKLSSQGYKIISSKDLDLEQPQSTVRPLGKGFSYSVPSMRSGYHADFQYDKVAKKMRLVSVDRYEFGPANNDGSGESEVNLLTNTYIGDWNYYDNSLEKLIKIPTIKQKMILPTTYLDSFSEELIYEYSERCSKIYEQAKHKATANGSVSKKNVYWRNFHPFKDKSYVVSFKKNQDNANSTVYFINNKSTAKKVVWQEDVLINQSDDFVRYEDFNGDGLKDLLVFSTTGARGGNEFYYLYLIDYKNNKLLRVNGFNEIVNPTYDANHRVVVSYGLAGRNYYTVYKIVGYEIRQVGGSFVDDFESDPVILDKKISKILSAKPVKK